MTTLLQPATIPTLTRELERAWRGWPATPNGCLDRSSAPDVRRSEDDGTWKVEIDLPGVAPDSLEVYADAGALEVAGTRTLVGSEVEVRRSFRLPQAAGEVSAAYQHGVLTITVAKPEVAQRRKVEVEVA